MEGREVFWNLGVDDRLNFPKILDRKDSDNLWTNDL